MKSQKSLELHNSKLFLTN